MDEYEIFSYDYEEIREYIDKFTDCEEKVKYIKWLLNEIEKRKKDNFYGRLNEIGYVLFSCVEKLECELKYFEMQCEEEAKKKEKSVLLDKVKKDKRHFLNWINKKHKKDNLYQIFALLELLEKAGFIAEGSCKEVGRITAHTFLQKNEYINPDDITKKKKEADYINSRLSIMEKLIDTLDKKAYTKFVKEYENKDSLPYYLLKKNNE